MSSIIKLCADHLRAFSNNHGVKLKSGHAHELVAAFFGYKSKAAMQADNLCPITKLKQAQFFVLVPSLFIDERRKCMEGLPSDLPDTYTLGEEMFVKLISDEQLSFRVFPSWKHLAEALTCEYLQKHGNLALSLNFGDYKKARYMFNKPLYEFKPKIETIDNKIKLTVTNRYYGSHDVHFQSIDHSIDIVIKIELTRIAGYVGYSDPEISVIDISNQSISQGVSL